MVVGGNREGCAYGGRSTTEVVFYLAVVWGFGRIPFAEGVEERRGVRWTTAMPKTGRTRSKTDRGFLGGTSKVTALLLCDVPPIRCSSSVHLGLLLPSTAALGLVPRSGDDGDDDRPGNCYPRCS